MRMTISLPDELKTRMDSVNERVNWSAVAREAFEKRTSHELALEKVNIQRLAITIEGTSPLILRRYVSTCTMGPCIS